MDIIKEFLCEDYHVVEQDIQVIDWDYLEHRYIDNVGNMYKTIDDIPEDIQHLAKPIEPIKPTKLRRRRS